MMHSETTSVFDVPSTTSAMPVAMPTIGKLDHIPSTMIPMGLGSRNADVVADATDIIIMRRRLLGVSRRPTRRAPGHPVHTSPTAIGGHR